MQRTSNRYRFNRLWVGLLIGILLPCICFLLIYLIGYNQATLIGFIEQSYSALALPKFIGLSVIANLVAFHIFLKRQWWKGTKGIIAATLLYTLVVVVFKIME